MAEGEYRRLTCSAAGCEGKHKARGLCATHYRQLQRGRLDRQPGNCAHCGAGLDGKLANAVYCSKRCKLAAWRESNPERHAYHRERERPASCVPQEIKEQRRKERAAAAEAARQEKKARHKAAVIARNGSRSCLQCGAPCGYVAGRIRVYCSEACHRQSPAFKEGRRAVKLARKARTRGVDAESFSPSKVFDRDGWKCQICGRSTPKSRRGTLRANAPELDHIVPLSKGGPHTMANTQCTCRSCNHEKSDRFVIGQRGLFA